MKNLFVINPAAGKNILQSEIIENIKSYFGERGEDYRIVVTEKRGMAQDVAREEAQKGEKLRIWAAGGEGTAFEVLNGVVGYDNVSVGVIPCGSANDFLKGIGPKEDFLDIANQVNGVEVPIDIIKAGDKYAFNQCSAGLDAVVAHKMQKYKRIKGVSGSLAYNLAIVDALLSRIVVDMKIKVDGKLLEGVKCLFAVCANAPWYGGGYYSAPKAVMNDGILDYSIINIGTKMKVIPVLGVYRRGEHLGKDYAIYGNCECMEFESDYEMPINLDGEIFFMNKVKFEIVKNGIKLIVPKSLAHKFEKKDVATIG